MFFVAFPRNMIFAILLGFTMLFWINRGIILFMILFFLGSQKIFSFIRQVLNQIMSAPSHFYTDSIIEPLFAIMGQISKVDGNVSKNSINTVEKIIKDMRLDNEQRKRAIQAFKSGKDEHFDLHNALQKIHMHLLFNPHHQEQLLQNMIRLGHADGRPSKRKRSLLHHVTSSISQRVFQHQNPWQQHQFENDWQQHQTHQSTNQLLDQAYRTLNCSAQDSMADVTKNYRKMLSKYHPDRLAAKNASEQEIKAANDKTHEIKKAYELIKKAQVYST